MNSFKFRPAEQGLFLLALILIAYFPALQAGYIWDDPYHVTENPLLRTPLGLWRIWFEIGAQRQYYPLTLSVFWLEYQIWGLNPFFYHLVNVLLHGVNALLVWKLCCRLRLPGAWMAGAVFALHPVMVESVAWVTELKNVLSGFFYLSAAHVMIRYFRLDAPGADTSEQGNLKQWCAGFLLFACALCSKTVTATFPAALLVVLWWRNNCLRHTQFFVLLPFFVLGAAYGLLTVSMEQNLGATGPLWDFSFLDRCLIAGRALWFYLGKLLWPTDLLFNYQRWNIDDTSLPQYIFPCGFILLLFIAWVLRKKFGRCLLAALLFFAGTLFPALGFFNVYPMQFSFVADHFQYLASLGPILFCTGAAVRWWQQNKPQVQKIALFIVSLLLALLSLQTFFLSSHYADSETLYTWILKHNKNSYLANYNLGSLLNDWHRHQEAIPYLLQAQQLRPDKELACNNLGIAYAETGKLRKAAAQFTLAYQKNPANNKTLSNLVLTSLRLQDYDTALKQSEIYLQKWPKDSLFAILTGNEFRKQRQFAMALNLCRRVPETDRLTQLANNCVLLARRKNSQKELAQ